MKKLITFITTILALQLWFTNGDLMILTRQIAADGKPLSGIEYGILIISALAYSVISAIAVVKVKHYIYVLFFALLDGFAIYLRINIDQQYFILICSIFYAVYTAYLITACWLLNRQQTIPQSENADTTKEPDFTSKAKSELPPKSDPNYALIISAVRSISASKDSNEAISNILKTTDNPAVKDYIKKRYGIYPHQQKLPL